MVDILLVLHLIVLQLFYVQPSYDYLASVYMLQLIYVRHVICLTYQICVFLT